MSGLFGMARRGRSVKTRWSPGGAGFPGSAVVLVLRGAGRIGEVAMRDLRPGDAVVGAYDEMVSDSGYAAASRTVRSVVVSDEPQEMWRIVTRLGDALFTLGCRMKRLEGKPDKPEHPLGYGSWWMSYVSPRALQYNDEIAYATLRKRDKPYANYVGDFKGERECGTLRVREVTDPDSRQFFAPTVCGRPGDETASEPAYNLTFTSDADFEFPVNGIVVRAGLDFGPVEHERENRWGRTHPDGLA